MQIFVNLVAAILEVDSDEWQNKQFANVAAGKTSSWRMSEMVSGKLTAGFWAHAGRLLSNTGSVWHLLRPCYRTRRQASTVFAMLALGLGYFFLKVMDRFLAVSEQWWLIPNTGAEAALRIEQAPWCMMNLFSYRLRNKWPTAAKMQSADCIASLCMLLLLIWLSSSRIECRHSWLRRCALVTSTNRKTLDILSASFVINRMRLILQCWTKFSSSQQPRPIMKRPASAPAEFPFKRGGGPCWAYLHHLREVHGKSLHWVLSNTDWPSEYAKIKEEGGPMWERLVAIGQCGSEAKRHGGKAFKHLPPSSFESQPSEEVDMTCPDEVWQLAVRINDDRLHEEIRVAGTKHRSHVDASKRQQQDANHQLVAWSDAAARDKPPAHDGLRPMPVPVSVELLQWVWPIHDVVKHLVQRWPEKKYKDLRSYWTARHQMYLSENAPSVPSAKVAAAKAPDSAFKLKLCCLARMCLCDQHSLEHLVQRLKYLLRQDFKPASLMRTWCVKGHLLLGIHSLTAPPMLLHLSAINFNTFNAVTWRLLPDQEFPPENGSHVFASVDFSREHFGLDTWWRQLAALDLSHAYTMSWWRLVFDDAPLDIWAPGKISSSGA